MGNTAFKRIWVFKKQCVFAVGECEKTRLSSFFVVAIAGHCAHNEVPALEKLRVLSPVTLLPLYPSRGLSSQRGTRVYAHTANSAA